jgi:ATP-dependent DNA helicase RecQ
MNIHLILEKYWGHKQFRSLQEEIILSVLQGNDTLALLPTGGGKSICFQVPALATDGICIVISPLIALMKDQVENLVSRGIQAVAVTSAMSKKEIDIALENCVKGNVKFLYLSPERLENEVFQARVKRMKVSFIAVDEAHCISQWGYDFRPAYLNIAALREILRDKPVIALTATATPEVVKDISKNLNFKKDNLFIKSFERKNLAYVVQKEEDKFGRLLKISKNISGTGIVYVRNRKKTKEIAEFLQNNAIPADFYHAGLDPLSRSKKQENWIKNYSRIIVATNAFGMGIDKPDVRFVVHMDLPDSLEAYFQEAGRGGRDEKKSFAIVLYNVADVADLKRQAEGSFPPTEEIKIIYQALGNFLKIPIGGGKERSFDFDISDFCSTYNLNATTVYNSLKALEKEGELTLSEAFYRPSKVMITAGNTAVYDFRLRYPVYDAFIKLLLRSYSGLFEGYVKISEFDLAKRAVVSKDKVIDMLKTLEKYNILSYLSQSDLPHLVFLRDRKDHKDLFFSKENYFKRKTNYLEKVDSVIDYVSSEHKCRSEILLSYFGEKKTDSCGQCDVCLEEKKRGVSVNEFEIISKEIQQRLMGRKISLNELVDSIKGAEEEKILSTLKWLIDQNKVKEQLGELEWKGE